MKKLLVSLLCVVASSSALAFVPATVQSIFSSCPQAAPTTDGGFCASFKSVASCQCVEKGVPSSVCQNIDLLYKVMIARYHSVENACANQHDTSTQNCIDDWKCYMSGGTNSQGGLCSSTGSKC